jgi:hypothetical protein
MERHREDCPCDLWFPMVRRPEDRARLGASAWKPTYRIVPEEGRPAVAVLPGHLVVADPQALRLEFLYRLFQLGYRTRNRSIEHRRSTMVRGLLAELLLQDLLNLGRLKPPTLTWTVLGAALPAARALARGTITRARLEDALRRLFVRRRHRRRYPDRRVVLPFVDELTLALDIDTEEEARDHGGELAGGDGG